VAIRAVSFVDAIFSIGAQLRYVEILVWWPPTVLFPMVIDTSGVVMRFKKRAALHSFVLIHIKIEWVNGFE
jgi:hypothetical protein